MNPEDVIGKKFIAFKFNDKVYNSQYKEAFGRESRVIHFHPYDRNYVYCSTKIRKTTTILNYYPVQGIIDQLEEKQREESMTIDDVINQIKQITSEL